MSTDSSKASQEAAPRWQGVGPIDRRVLGVLVEKAKTTSSAYPMSANAICTGANQKNNRFPVMQLEPDDVEESLERLRHLGAVGMIEGLGRVQKYRHYLYEWLGVDKVELAVMAELLLRGAQTEGALRGRAARMEPIADLSALRPLIQSLKAKGLIVPLTPEGRGHVLTHNLYPQRELENLKRHIAQSGAAALAPSEDAEDAAAGPSTHVAAGASRPSHSAGPVAPGAAPGGQPAPASELTDLRRTVEELRSLAAQLRSDLDDLASSLHQTADDVRRLKADLGG
jgi:uncharacterized protein YceH (UPF0502 family)